MDLIWANCRPVSTRATISTDCPSCRRAVSCVASCASTSPTASRGLRSPPSNWWRWRRNSARNNTCPSPNGRNSPLPCRSPKLRWRFGSRTDGPKPSGSKKPSWKSCGWRRAALSVTWCHPAPRSAFSARAPCPASTALDPGLLPPAIRATATGLTATSNRCRWWAPSLHFTRRARPWRAQAPTAATTTTRWRPASPPWSTAKKEKRKNKFLHSSSPAATRLPTQFVLRYIII